MASTKARSCISTSKSKVTNDKMCGDCYKKPVVDFNKQEEYPIFTKELYMSKFPLPIPEKHPVDKMEAEPNEFLIPQIALGSDRIGHSLLVRRRDFTKMSSTAVPVSDDGMLVVWTKMDARIVDYVDAVRIKAPFIVEGRDPSPFITKILLSFRARLPGQLLHYHLISEYWKGQASLCTRLQEVGRLSEDGAKFYSIELADALFYIHKQSKIFRRLCTCYLLVKETGHLLVAPFTICKQNLDCGQACNMLTRNCGDQFYASPEVVFGVEVTSAADWWSYGVILYQFLTGEVPFTGRTLGDLGKAITESNVDIPPYLSPEAAAFIKQLLHKDPRRRLGFGKSAQRDIMSHPFFSGIDWRGVRSLTLDIDPPFKKKSEYKMKALLKHQKYCKVTS